MPVADGKRIPFRKQRRILGETPRNRSISYDASGRDCFTEYFRVYCLGGKAVRIMQYEPRNEPHLRYVIDGPPVDKITRHRKEYTLKLCKGLGYDFNTVEFAVRDGIPYAIDFGNPA
jgi:hypothetical protein